MSLLTFNSPQTLRRDVQPGAYLTDGTRLYRVVHTLRDPWAGQCAELEDCMTLRTRVYEFAEMYDMDMRLVRRPVRV